MDNGAKLSVVMLFNFLTVNITFRVTWQIVLILYRKDFVFTRLRKNVEVLRAHCGKARRSHSVNSKVRLQTAVQIVFFPCRAPRPPEAIISDCFDASTVLKRCNS